MTTSRDKAARFCRLAGGKNSTLSVGTTATAFALDGRCVAFNVQNASVNGVALRSDGTTATIASGWTLTTATQTGWIDCVGGLTLSIIADTAASRVDVWQILDEAP